MAYADISHIQALNPARTYAAQTTPNIEQVLLYADLRSAELDAVLADMGISTPVPATATVSFGWLRAACAYGAAADAEAAMFPGTVNRDQTGHLQYLQGRWDQMLDALTKGRVNLTDAPRVASTSAGTAPLGLRRTLATTGVATSWFRGEHVDTQGGW